MQTLAWAFLAMLCQYQYKTNSFEMWVLYIYTEFYQYKTRKKMINIGQYQSRNPIQNLSWKFYISKFKPEYVYVWQGFVVLKHWQRESLYTDFIEEIIRNILLLMLNIYLEWMLLNKS